MRIAPPEPRCPTCPSPPAPRPSPNPQGESPQAKASRHQGALPPLTACADELKKAQGMWTIIMDPTTCTSSAEHPKGKRPDHMEVITCVRAAVARTNNLSIFDHTKVVVQEKNTNNDVS